MNHVFCDSVIQTKGLHQEKGIVFKKADRIYRPQMGGTLFICPIYRAQTVGVPIDGTLFMRSSISTPEAGLFRTLYRAMLAQIINDNTLNNIEVWRDLLTKAAIDQITDCNQLFMEYMDFDRKKITPQLNAFEIFRHILLATGISIKEADISRELIGVNLKATPVFTQRQPIIKLNPVYANVIERLITNKVNREFINTLKKILSGKSNLFYPDAQPEYQWRPLDEIILFDLKDAARLSHNVKILNLLSQVPCSSDQKEPGIEHKSHSNMTI